MYGTRRLCLTGLALGALLAGCLSDGGRGSSGFDITENYIISRVLETQECLSKDRLTVCPADRDDDTTPVPTATAATPTMMVSPTMTPTAVPTPRVDTGLTGGASIACTREHSGAPCALIFSFAAVGFAPEATFRVASRLRAPDSDWVLAEPPTLDGASQPGMLGARVALPVPADAADPRVQFAVLVFLAPPEMVPTQFVALAETGTDFAFVTPELALEVITTGPPPSPTATATTIDHTPSPSPSAATPTVTATPARSGPEITYFGVARADSFSLAPSDFDPDGRPIYLRPFGHSLSLIIEGRPGPSGRGVGQSAYDTAGGLPDLQLIVSRPLGNGSVEVCDDMPPLIGGVPAASPFAFSDDPALVAAINDLGCRTDNGAGSPLARSATTACTLDGSGEYAFVDDTTTAQFCVPISVPWAFPAGDTIVAARLRDVAGNLGAPREIVLRNAAVSGPTATAPPTSTRTRRPPFSPTPTPDESQPSATPADTSTITITPTPTLTPLPGDTPQITHFGLARADDRPLSAVGSDDEGRPIYSRLTGQGMVIIVEARAGGRPLGRSAYRPEGVPDLEIILSRPLGDGSTMLCDIEPPLVGGVPATDPLRFSDDPEVALAVNDLGCRVNDGTGQPRSRAGSDACTIAPGAGSGFGFINSSSMAQYCLPIAAAWAFGEGDTIIAARVHDIDGRASAVREIVVRVGDSQ